MQKLLHKEISTQRSLYTQKPLTQRSLSTMELLHTDAFTRRSFYRQTLLRREVFTQRTFYTQKLLHWEAWPLSSFVTLQFRKFTADFNVLPSSFCAKGLHRTFQNLNFTPVFDIRPSFRTKRHRHGQQNNISPHVCASNTHDPCGGCHGQGECAFHHTFGRPTRAISAEVDVS